MNEFINSTLDKKSRARLIENIPVNSLIKGYKKDLNIDVSRFFKEISKIGIYECEKTKYRFFYPFNIDGDSSFYQELQEYDWYYMPWKWEHEATKKLLSGKEKILEVGSGGLGFLENMNQAGYDVTGLELNRDSIKKAKELGLNVFQETVQEHAKHQFEAYDVVCSYQVLEHIAEVNSFINAQIDCLKPGGKLIIAVPNNDSFIRLSEGGPLNKPPHHMGLWNKISLKRLVNCFNLEIVSIYYEPLQNYHMDWYIESIITFKIKPHKIFNKIFEKLRLKRLLRQYVRLKQKNIKGHTMLAIYKKG